MLLRKTLLAVGLSCLASFANAGLTITNNTDFPSTAIINNGACSTILGKEGTTQPHSTNTVGDTTIKLACIAKPSNCSAVLYMTKDCKGDAAADIIFDTKTGIKDIKNKGTIYKVSGSAFSATIDKA